MIEKKVLVVALVVGVLVVWGLYVWFVYHSGIAEEKRIVPTIITVEKVEVTPQEEIIELTEEEVATHPILKHILDELERTGKHSVDYETAESNSMEILNYIENRYESRYNSLAGYPHFEYKGEVYILVVMIS